ncbi:CAP domain-containing protein [Halosquirtibacter laminarini]|uniref:CAP domain-containing protein n=1 Tax=Halosquirtibacter laminarini TaxID=3374600 RepID=A0AC61NDN1_9BACT|nr:CAP domain-containing protein [Prolixibacteraceae bacterium]
MNKLIALVILLSTFTCISCSKDDEDPNSVAKGGNVEHKMMLDEINFLRTRPQEYAKKRLEAASNKGTDNGAYNEIMALQPLNALKLNDQLIASATNYAAELSNHAHLSHDYGGSLGDRITSFGYSWTRCGENIAMGTNTDLDYKTNAVIAAQEFVLIYVIDRGVQGVGHRKNLISPHWKEIGIGYYSKKGIFYNAQQFGCQ